MYNATHCHFFVHKLTNILVTFPEIKNKISLKYTEKYKSACQVMLYFEVIFFFLVTFLSSSVLELSFSIMNCFMYVKYCIYFFLEYLKHGFSETVIIFKHALLPYFVYNL